MSRRDEVNSNFEKPAKLYLDWSSDEQTFTHYDKSANEGKGANVPFDPGKFLFLMQRHTIKGWSEQHECGMYAPEVKDLQSEPLTVKAFKDNIVIAKGLYSEIKEVVKNAGGRYTASIYAMLEDGTVVNFQLKGIALKQWMDFTQKSRARLADEWVSIKEIGTGKKGKVNYSFPVFQYDGSLNAKAGKLADEVYEEIIQKLSPSARKSAASEEHEGFEQVDVVEEF